jgi:hypothetical protein
MTPGIRCSPVSTTPVIYYRQCHWHRWLTLTLTSSNYYMSPLSLSTCFSHWRFAPFHVFFTKPFREWETFLSTRRAGFAGTGNGTERIPMLCARDGMPLAEEVTGSKGPISLALDSWRWGGGYGGGRYGDWQWKGGGWRIFYRRPVLTSITLAFFKSMCSAHSSCGIKSPTISKFWSYKWKKNI